MRPQVAVSQKAIIFTSISVCGYKLFSERERETVKQYGNSCCCYSSEQLSSLTNRWIQRIWRGASTVLERKAFHLPQQPGSVTFERELESTRSYLRIVCHSRAPTGTMAQTHGITTAHSVFYLVFV
jgi:hypothetical protein